MVTLVFLAVFSLLPLVITNDYYKRDLAIAIIEKNPEIIKDINDSSKLSEFIVTQLQITDGDYISFYRRKFDLHEEMDSLTELTEKKIKQVTFKILEQAGLINDIKNRLIQPQIIDYKFMKALVQDNPNWLKVLLVSDTDIQRAKE